jgi:hypothetical protein
MEKCQKKTSSMIFESPSPMRVPLRVLSVSCPKSFSSKADPMCPIYTPIPSIVRGKRSNKRERDSTCMTHARAYSGVVKRPPDGTFGTREQLSTY